VTDWKEFRFKIKGDIEGVEITPYMIPLSRLALYLVDLAQLLGHNDSVHLLKIEDGSAQPLILIDALEESRVIHQVQNAQRGMGPRNANRAYKKLDNKLRQDNATAAIMGVAGKVIEFPGKTADLPMAYGPIRERASATGELKRIGGFDETIPIHLKRTDGVVLYCEASEAIAKQLAPFYSQTIRVHGIATYTRGKEGMWTTEHFKIQSFDEKPLIDESFTETIAKLRAVPGNEWAEIADPLEELRKIRQGEEMTQP
jgi:hypothetical protein